MKGVPVPVDEYVSRFVELEFPITSQFCEIKTSPFHLNLEYLDSWPLHVWSELPRLISRARYHRRAAVSAVFDKCLLISVQTLKCAVRNVQFLSYHLIV